MKLRSHGPLAPFLLLLTACAGQPSPEPAASPEDVASPGPDPAAAAPESVEPPVAPPAAASVAPPPPPLVWEKELERKALPKGHGTAVLGVSACEDGVRGLLVKRETPSGEPAQAEFDRFVGCELSRSGQGWSSRISSAEETRVTRFELASIVLDPSTVAVFLNVLEGDDDAIVLSQGEKFDRFDFGRLSDSTTDTVLSPPGELSRILRADGRSDFMWYDAYAIKTNPELGLEETPRDVWMARTLATESYEAAAAAKGALVTSCARLESRIAVLEVRSNDDVSYWVGIPSLTRSDAQTGVRDLQNCRQKATVEVRKAPAPEAPPAAE